MLIVGDTQYENDPGVLDLLRQVVRAHPDAIGYMSLIEDAIHVVVKTPKPKPVKSARAKPNADAAGGDEPEAKTEQAPIRPPHLEALKWGPVRAEIRTSPPDTAPSRGRGKIVLAGADSNRRSPGYEPGEHDRAAPPCCERRRGGHSSAFKPLRPACPPGQAFRACYAASSSARPRASIACMRRWSASALSRFGMRRDTMRSRERSPRSR